MIHPRGALPATWVRWKHCLRFVPFSIHTSHTALPQASLLFHHASEDHEQLISFYTLCGGVGCPHQCTDCCLHCLCPPAKTHMGQGIVLQSKEPRHMKRWLVGALSKFCWTKPHVAFTHPPHLLTTDRLVCMQTDSTCHWHLLDWGHERDEMLRPSRMAKYIFCLIRTLENSFAGSFIGRRKKKKNPKGITAHHLRVFKTINVY